MKKRGALQKGEEVRGKREGESCWKKRRGTSCVFIPGERGQTGR
jgi:hypothetical protein